MGIENIQVLKPYADESCVLCGHDKTDEGYCTRERCLYSKSSIETHVTAS